MLYLPGEYASQIPRLNAFRHIPFRTGGALLTALVLVLLFLPRPTASLGLRQGMGPPPRASRPASPP